MDQNQFTESGNSPPLSLPILMPADVAEIRENARRIGRHNDEGRCDCPGCVERRNKPKGEKFRRRMLRYGFKDNGRPLDETGWAFLLRKCSLGPLDLKQFNFVWPEPRFTKPTLRISPSLPSDERNVSGSEKAWPASRGKIPSPSMSRLDRYGLAYLTLSACRHKTSLPYKTLSPNDEIYDPFKGRSLTAAVGTENRSIRTGKDDAASYRDYIGGCETELPAPKPDSATYVGPCTCPRSTGLKQNGEPREPHEADIFVYTDGSTRVECPYVDERYNASCSYLAVWKLSPALQAAGFDGIEYSKELQKRWEKKLTEQRKKKKLFVRSINEKLVKADEGEGLNEDVDINVDENGDEVGISTPAEAYGLDWIEDGATRKSTKSAFNVDAEEFVKATKRRYGFDVRLRTREELIRDPRFSKAARAYMVRVRYAAGLKISDSEKRQHRRTTKEVTKGTCPTGTCPDNACTDASLSLIQQREIHALGLDKKLSNVPHEKLVGRWYCIVALGDRDRIKLLPDISKFAGATEDERLLAAFHALIEEEMKTAKKQARRSGKNPKAAKEVRRAAFYRRIELVKIG